MAMWNSATPQQHVAITPSDSTQLNLVGIYVGVTGNVALADSKGTVVTYIAVAAGETISLQTTRVMATNTTATSIVGFLGS